jgi:GrpB-like predicted nucleotidyltransferase (UPF0157 family)
MAPEISADRRAGIRGGSAGGGENDGVTPAEQKPLRIVDYDAAWPARFVTIGTALRERLGAAAVRIDHIGSTAVPGLAAKDIIDVQVTVASLDAADDWPDELLPNLMRRYRGTADDHVPPGATADARQWTKHYWAERGSIHLRPQAISRARQCPKRSARSGRPAAARRAWWSSM